MSQSEAEATGPGNTAFPQTRWSLIMNAREDDPAALAELCRLYWFPLYCYARRLVAGVEDARDLTQAYFEHLLEQETFKAARAERGRLRTFLLAGMQNFAISRHRKASTQKRGSGQAWIEIDAMEAEQRYAIEPRDHLSPEREFDRAWARQLLDAVLTKMAAIYTAAGKSAVFMALRDHLATGETSEYAAIGTQLDLSPGRVRLAAFKLRERYRELLREVIRETVETESEVEEELKYLRELFES